MFLNVGGAVLGVAILTAISNSVTSAKGGKENPEASLDGYRAGYYGSIAMAGLGALCALFFYDDKTDTSDDKTTSDSELATGGKEHSTVEA